VVLAAVFNVIGPLIAGTAVANTVASVVRVPTPDVISVVGAALVAALIWNLATWWRGLPSSSSHALVGGLIGASMAATGLRAVRWGGIHGIRPVGVIGVLLSLAISPVLGFGAGVVGSRVARRALRRATRSIDVPIRRGEWFTASALAFSHGANDAQKTMGVIGLLLVASGHLRAFSIPLWVKLACAAALTVGTSLGGWRIVRTLGTGIYRLRPVDGLASQGGSATVILTSALVGGPVSTTHVVAASVVGVGAARGHRRVRWTIVEQMAAAWLVTLPVSALVAAASFRVGRLVP
jgi:PiT family inorganic phosphate transporter